MLFPDTNAMIETIIMRLFNLRYEKILIQLLANTNPDEARECFTQYIGNKDIYTAAHRQVFVQQLEKFSTIYCFIILYISRSVSNVHRPKPVRYIFHNRCIFLFGTHSDFISSGSES